MECFQTIYHNYSILVKIATNNLRSNNLKLSQRKPKTIFLKNSLSYRGAAAWNNIPINSINILKETTSLTGYHNIIDSCYNSLQYFTVPS
jgi:hypothetical protein